MFSDLLKVQANQIPNFCKPRDVGRNFASNEREKETKQKTEMTKTKFLLLILCISILGCNSKSENKKNIVKAKLKKIDSFNPTIIDSKLPLFIEKIDFENDKNLIQVNDGIETKISNVISEYLSKEFGNEEIKTSKNDTYLKTIRMNYNSYSFFLVILKSYPTKELLSKLLIYNNVNKEFIGNPIDFKIYALYDFENGKLKPTNLKKIFKIENPEIEILNIEKNGILKLS